MSRSLQLLTGTPVNKPTDAYAYIKLCQPTTYRSYTQFTNIHVEEYDFFGAPTKFTNIELLKKNLELFSVSRTKEEMHGYNIKPIYPDCTYELSSGHYKLYKRIVEEQLLLFDDGSKIDATSVQKLRHALQQVVVNYDFFSNDATNRSAAYDLIDITLESTRCAEIDRSKLIIWTKYKRTSGSVLSYVNAKGVKAVAAYGLADSEASIKAFMEDSETRVLVAQYQSASAGLNPQHVCSEALFLELDTVPLYIRQSCGRLDRVGQTKAPTLRFAVAKGTVQEGLLANLLKNDDMVSKIEPTKTGLRAMLLGNST